MKTGTPETYGAECNAELHTRLMAMLEKLERIENVMLGQARKPQSGHIESAPDELSACRFGKNLREN